MVSFLIFLIYNNKLINRVVIVIALDFDPDRFLDERLQKYLIPNPFIFLPFNAGPRICLGQQVRDLHSFLQSFHPFIHPFNFFFDQNKKFAYNESSFFLIRLLQNFSLVSLSEESQPPDSRAPQVWKLEAEGGRKSKEKIQPKSHLTMFLKVM